MQKMRMILLVFTMFFFYAGNVYSEETVKIYPVIKNGNLSEVKLLEVRKALPNELKTTLAGANDGLVFYFIITRQDGVDGLFTLSEFKDFKENQLSYSKQTGKKIEPQTFIEGIDNFINKIRPDLKKFISISSSRYGVVMITYIGGSTITSKGTISFDIKVGWNKKLESFNFELPVSAIKKTLYSQALE